MAKIDSPILSEITDKSLLDKIGLTKEDGRIVPFVVAMIRQRGFVFSVIGHFDDGKDIEKREACLSNLYLIDPKKRYISLMQYLEESLPEVYLIITGRGRFEHYQAHPGNNGHFFFDLGSGNYTQ